MPPASSQKGTGKKGGGVVRQRSRNTTPSAIPAGASLPPIEKTEVEYLELQVEVFRNISYDDLVDQTASNAVIPDSKTLDGMIARLEQLRDTMEKRSNFCDRSMRLLAQTRKHQRMEEIIESRSQDERSKTDDEDQQKRSSKKKRKLNDSLAPDDAKHERSSPLRDNSKARRVSRDNDSTSSSLSPVAPATPTGAMEVDEKSKAEENEEESSSEDEGAPPPRAVPQSQTFGEDPSTFPDPTVYEIREVKPGMSEDEIKEIYSVFTYPKSDLADQIAGDPPDKDFSSAKPSNQISFSTFSTYIEPYFRPFAEEDLGFLRERGDRVTPFNMPKRGKKYYLDVWAEEDSGMALDSPLHSKERLPPNQPRGNIENMDDDLAETDKLSVGPLLSRLLQAMRPESRAPAEEKPMTNGMTNGDISMNGDFGGDADGLGLGGSGNGISDDKTQPQAVPPATLMTESSSEAWKKATHPKLDYNQVDERVKQELRHIGFLPLEGSVEAEYDGHFDDEVAARLRLLQGRLREQMLINGARKARLTELVKERMAHQEYQTILEDLDSQVQAAYLKRTRTMGKSKKTKRPGGAGGGSHFVAGAAGAAGAAGMARPGIGDMTKTLMERRRRWIDTIGTRVFTDENLGRVPRIADPHSSIFKTGEMADLMKREKEQWEEEVEEE